MEAVCVRGVDEEAVVHREVEGVQDVAGEKGRDHLNGLVADGLRGAEYGAFGAEGVEVVEREVGSAVVEELVVGELVEDYPDQQWMLARWLWSGCPGGCVLMGAGLPKTDVEKLREGAESEDGEEDAGEVAEAHEGAVLASEFEEQQQDKCCPHGSEQEEDAAGKREGEHVSHALEDSGRDDDAQNQAHPGIEARARERSDDREEQQTEQKDVGQLRIDDAVEGEGNMHARVVAATQKVAVVHDEEDGGQADALAELLQHLIRLVFCEEE